MEKGKRVLKALTLSEKLNIISEVEKGAKKKKDIAADFSIAASTLSTILKDKEKIRNAVEESRFAPMRKRMKTSTYPQLEEAMFQWMKCARDKNISVQGPLIKEKAESYAQELGIQSFQASTGWLDNFKHRNGIVQKVMSGESASVSEEDCENYRCNVLPTLLENYSPEDVFNADETGLFFKCLPEKTLAFKGEKCHGGKRSKERVTVMVGANMTGTEKLKLLMIGKSGKPRCFSRVKSLPVDYEHNKKAWMTSVIFESWLNKLDKKFQREKRRILLFVDNCTAHPKMTESLKAIKLVFLPPNMTSKLQPMDQGIIKNLKYFYRKKCLQRILTSVESGNPVTDINLLDAVIMLQKSWADVKSETIANCFRKAGFSECGPELEEQHDTSAPIPEEWPEFQSLLSVEEDFETFLNVDADLIIADHPTDKEIINCVMTAGQNDSAEEEEEEEVPQENTLPSATQALEGLATFRQFVQGQVSVGDDIFSAVNLLENFVDNRLMQNKKQKRITDFFNV